METHYVYDNQKFYFYLLVQGNSRYIVYVHESVHKLWMGCFRNNFFEFSDISDIINMSEIGARLIHTVTVHGNDGLDDMDREAMKLSREYCAVYDRTREKSSEFICMVQQTIYTRCAEIYNKIKQRHDRIHRIREKTDHLKSMYNRGIITQAPRYRMLDDSYYSNVLSWDGLTINDAKCILFFHRDAVMGDNLKIINE